MKAQGPTELCRLVAGLTQRPTPFKLQVAAVLVAQARRIDHLEAALLVDGRKPPRARVLQ